MTKTFTMSRDNALTINAERLYETATQRAGTQNVIITIQPGRLVKATFVPQRAAFPLPRANAKVGEFVASDYDEVQITISESEQVFTTDVVKTYTLEHFVNLTLAKWESYLPYVDVSTEKGLQAERDLINAMDCLKKTYAWNEIYDGPGFGVSEFRAYFAPAEGSHHGA
jgi:hypothetical protein